MLRHVNLGNVPERDVELPKGILHSNLAQMIRDVPEEATLNGYLKISHPEGELLAREFCQLRFEALAESFKLYKANFKYSEEKAFKYAVKEVLAHAGPGFAQARIRDQERAAAMARLEKLRLGSSPVVPSSFEFVPSPKMAMHFAGYLF